MVRFLICLGIWLCWYKWRMIKTFGVMIENVGAFTRNMEFSLLPLWGKSVSATMPYSRPCFPLQLTTSLRMLQLQHDYFLNQMYMYTLIQCTTLYIYKYLFPFLHGVGVYKFGVIHEANDDIT